MYRSPTCTAVDQYAAEEFAKIANFDVMEFAGEMFEAGSDLKNKTVDEIFYQDYKNFNVGDVSFGVGQINSLNALELVEIKERLVPYLEKALKEHEVDMIFFMLTNIIRESSEILCVGTHSQELVEGAFNVKGTEDGYMLDKVVSRKKQLIPALVAAIQE